jgi:murein DD-endopeptidase MepM/ murein hydrolase activator NlpD
MTEMPRLGRRPRRPLRPLFVLLLLGLMATAGVWYLRRGARPPAGPTSAPLPVADAAPPAAPPVVAADAGPPPSLAEEELAKAGLKRLRIEVRGSLEPAVIEATGAAEGPALAQVLVRPLVWWLSVPGDLYKGDRLEALYQSRPEGPVLVALRYRSNKLGQLLRTYRYKAAADAWPRLFTPDGSELEQRLKDAPIDDYEQVTSLLRDGRGHRGVDFKAPAGTPIKAPFDALVVRRNWNWKSNGNCLELRERGGRRTAIFLHLAEPPAVPNGARVARGEVVAKAGNTGHSFAPHVHYQLMAGDKVLDPFAVQETYRRSLAQPDAALFAAEVSRLDRLLDLD